MWKLVYLRPAAKMLERMDRPTAERIRTKMRELAKAPHARNSNAVKLQGVEGYRLRVGDWRVIYTLDHDVLTVVVVRIGPRGSVYE